nr:MAG: hypothetical protein Ga0209084_10007141 [Lavidaviridae sp.]
MNQILDATGMRDPAEKQQELIKQEEERMAALNAPEAKRAAEWQAAEDARHQSVLAGTDPTFLPNGDYRPEHYQPKELTAEEKKQQADFEAYQKEWQWAQDAGNRQAEADRQKAEWSPYSSDEAGARENGWTPEHGWPAPDPDLPPPVQYTEEQERQFAAENAAAGRGRPQKRTRAYTRANMVHTKAHRGLTVYKGRPCYRAIADPSSSRLHGGHMNPFGESILGIPTHDFSDDYKAAKTVGNMLMNPSLYGIANAINQSYGQGRPGDHHHYHGVHHHYHGGGFYDDLWQGTKDFSRGFQGGFTGTMDKALPYVDPLFRLAGPQGVAAANGLNAVNRLAKMPNLGEVGTGRPHVMPWVEGDGRPQDVHTMPYEGAGNMADNIGSYFRDQADSIGKALHGKGFWDNPLGAISNEFTNPNSMLGNEFTNSESKLRSDLAPKAIHELSDPESLLRKDYIPKAQEAVKAIKEVAAALNPPDKPPVKKGAGFWDNPLGAIGNEFTNPNSAMRNEFTNPNSMLGNEFTNPDSKLRSDLAPKAIHELTDPESLLRKDYIPKAAEAAKAVKEIAAALQGGAMVKGVRVAPDPNPGSYASVWARQHPEEVKGKGYSYRGVSTR